MPNRAKQKGTRWESAVRDYLADRLGVRVERLPAGSRHDRGDLAGVEGMCVECKDVGRLDLAGWCDEATVEAANVGDGTLPVVVAKRRGKGVEHGYVIMPLWAWTEFLNRRNGDG